MVTFTLHRHVRRKFKRQWVIVPYVDYQWDADTVSMTVYAKDNEGYGFFSLVIDVFSRYVWTVPLRTTKGSKMKGTLKSVFDRGRILQHFRWDKGIEFKNKSVQKLTKTLNVKQFFTQNESTANYAERAIKNIKSLTRAVSISYEQTYQNDSKFRDRLLFSPVH
jgi:predicted ABC-type exoprotein transport system permease subunit